MSHLGNRHELARQRRRQRAVGDILGEELKGEIFAELIEYERAIAEQRRKDHKIQMLKNKMNERMNSQIKMRRKREQQQKEAEEMEERENRREKQRDSRRRKKVSPDELRQQCRRRVAKRAQEEREKRLAKQKDSRPSEAEKRSAKQAMKEAQERILKRGKRQKEAAEEELSDLILRLPSSVEATNLTRLLDPEYQPKFVFQKSCGDEENKRLQKNLDI